MGIGLLPVISDIDLRGMRSGLFVHTPSSLTTVCSKYDGLTHRLNGLNDTKVLLGGLF